MAATADVGGNAIFWVAATGSEPLSYQWSLNNVPIPGATNPVLSLSDVQATSVGNYSVSVSNAGGSANSSTASLSINTSTSGGSPTFNLQPTSQTIASGSTVVFDATASAGSGAASVGTHAQVVLPGNPQTTDASGAITYQWFLNQNAIPGATSSTYVLSGATAADNGSYTCVATSSAGSVVSNAANLSVVASSDPGRLINISCRAVSGSGSNQLIAGYVVGGQNAAGSQPLLIRASGPALAAFGVAGILPDPVLTLNSTAGIVATDSGWAGNALVASTAASVGAFTWTTPTSRDSALVESLAPGAYTAQVTGASGDSGVALAEVYDATPSGAYTGTSPRLMNISARVRVGTGANILIAGFVVGGSTSKTVLVRGAGPALANYGVSGLLTDPQLTLYQSNPDGTKTLIQSNEGWAGSPQIASVASAVGAFSWGTQSTADSAILVTLPPGDYTAQVAGASGDSGVALVEVYDVP